MQLSYSQKQIQAFAGQLYDINFDDVYTYAWEGSAPLPFGSYVAKDSSGDSRCKLPGGAGDITSPGLFGGIAVATQALENPIAASANQQVPVGYPKYSACSILRRGRIWVAVEEAVTPESPVMVRFATGVADTTKTTLGTFRASADSATAAQLPNAVYMTSAAAGGFAVVELR